MKKVKISKKSLVGRIVAMAVVLGMISTLLIFWLSNAKYTSKIEGKTEYDPALFNTVLLGDLKFSHNVKEKSEDGYLDTKTVVETNGKLATSIIVDQTMEFGAISGQSGDMTSDERRLRPGSMVAIPFTVTNGTTLNGEDENGNPLVSNLAETDILYSLSLTTTINIPLKYEVYSYTTEAQLNYMKTKSADDEYNYLNYKAETGGIAVNTANDNWGTKLYTEEGKITNSPLIGFSRTYTIRPTTYDKDSNDEEINKFSLIRDEESDEISINRYMLVIYWPDDTEAQRSTEYMKEIDILEVRLEVESFVKNTAVANPEYKEGSTSVLSINAAPVGSENYYILPSAADNPTGPNVDNVYGRFTVPFYATRVNRDNNSTPYDYLDFIVSNKTGTITYTWNEAKGEYDVTMPPQNSLENGKIALAVPVKEIMGTVNDYTADTGFTYSIEYNGKTYVGTLTDKYITTDVWGKNEDEDTKHSKPYDSSVKNAYRIVEFYEAATPGAGEAAPLKLLNYTSSAILEEKLRLIIKHGENISYDNKDNFKILVYKETAVSEEVENPGDDAGETP